MPGQFEVYLDDELLVEKENVSLWKALLGNRGIPSNEKVLKLLKRES